MVWSWWQGQGFFSHLSGEGCWILCQPHLLLLLLVTSSGKNVRRCPRKTFRKNVRKDAKKDVTRYAKIMPDRMPANVPRTPPRRPLYCYHQRAKCPVPDLNRDHVRPAGPPPSVCRASTATIPNGKACDQVFTRQNAGKNA